jgi:hypothetical protein
MRIPRTSLTALLLAVLALAAAGCGGSEVSADEVPGPPPALTVPSDNAIGTGGSGAADGSTEPGATPTPDASATPDASGTGASTDGATAPSSGTSGGTTAPDAETTPSDTATTDQAPAAGSAPQQFESFCEQNAGAC